MTASAASSLSPYHLRPGAALEPLEHAPQLRPRDEREHDVPGGVRDVERDSGREAREQGGLGVRVEPVPEPEIHHRAEGEAEQEREGGEDEASPQQRPQEPREQAAAAPGEHLPGRVRPLAEEEVRRDRRERADREAAPRAERDPGRRDDNGHRLHARHRRE